jgi:hypothetical protein
VGAHLNVVHACRGLRGYVHLLFVGLYPLIVARVRAKQVGAVFLGVIVEPLEKLHVELELALTHLLHIYALLGG